MTMTPMPEITERLTSAECEMLERALSTPNMKFHVVRGGAFAAVVEGLLSAHAQRARAEAWAEGAAHALSENPYA